MKRLLLLIATLCLAACAGFGPTTYTLSEPELQQLVERKFPLDRRLLEVLEVQVATPQIHLLPDRNRIATAFEVSTTDRLFGAHWQGRLALEAGLRYEAGDQTLRLKDVRVDDFTLDNGDSRARSQADRLGALVAERVLEDMVLYRLPAERRDKLKAMGLVPDSVAVTARGVEIRFKRG